MRDDEKKRRYNPILKLYGGRAPDERELEMISAALKNRLFDAEGAFDLMSCEHEIVNNLIANLLFLGIPDTTKKIIRENNCNKNDKKDKGKELSYD
jgi:hypothetical protein